MDRLTAEKLETDAGIAGAQAQMKTAEVNLAYTRILAPISGRIGRSEHSPGDLIGPNSGTLTTLVSIDPIHAHIFHPCVRQPVVCIGGVAFVPFCCRGVCLVPISGHCTHGTFGHMVL
jgi:multidrug efflux pump subunit AcrA (membrane-fusion protein)